MAFLFQIRRHCQVTFFCISGKRPPFIPVCSCWQVVDTSCQKRHQSPSVKSLAFLSVDLKQSLADLNGPTPFRKLVRNIKMLQSQYRLSEEEAGLASMTLEERRRNKRNLGQIPGRSQNRGVCVCVCVCVRVPWLCSLGPSLRCSHCPPCL